MRYLVLHFFIQLCECLLVTLWLKYWIPSKICWSAWFNNGPITLPTKTMDWSSFPGGIGEDALSISCLVLKPMEKSVKTGEAKEAGERNKTEASLFQVSSLAENPIFSYKAP